MRKLVKISLSAGALTYTVGVLATSMSGAQVLLAAVLVPPAIILGSKAVEKGIFYGSKAKNWVVDNYKKNKNTIHEIANNFNLLNPEQNTTLLGAIGGALGTATAVTTEQNPLLGAGIGALTGAGVGYFVSDQKIGNTVESVGFNLARQGAEIR